MLYTYIFCKNKKFQLYIINMNKRSFDNLFLTHGGRV